MTIGPGLTAMMRYALRTPPTEYQPKFCRTPRCTLEFKHDGAHNQPAPKPGPASPCDPRPTVDGAPRRAAVRRAAMAEHKAAKRESANTKHTGRSRRYYYGALSSTPRHVNAGARGEAVRDHMAAVRRGDKPEPLPNPQAPSRRQQILARRPA